MDVDRDKSDETPSESLNLGGLINYGHARTLGDINSALSVKYVTLDHGFMTVFPEEWRNVVLASQRTTLKHHGRIKVSKETGFGIHLKHLNLSLFLKLPDYASTYQAEMMGYHVGIFLCFLTVMWAKKPWIMCTPT